METHAEPNRLLKVSESCKELKHFYSQNYTVNLQAPSSVHLKKKKNSLQQEMSPADVRNLTVCGNIWSEVTVWYRSWSHALQEGVTNVVIKQDL